MLTAAHTSLGIRCSLALLFFIGTLWVEPTQPALAGMTTTIRYVKRDASGANTGTSWTNAYKDLQSAIGAASSGDEIWVAAGTYTPTTDTDRARSFSLKNGVAIYGGFAGTETSRAQRDFAIHITMLSGDIGVVDDPSDNSYHVVSNSSINNTAILDGFTIKAGNADAYDEPHDRGAGIYNFQSNPVLANLIISNHYAESFGGGIYNDDSNPTLTNVTFSKNTSNYLGGGMYNEGFSSPTLTNVTFLLNTATYAGGGLTNLGKSNPVLTDVKFMYNTSAEGGGMLNTYGSNPILTRVTFDGNSVSDRGGGMRNSSSTPVLTDVLFTNNSAPSGGGMENSKSSPVLTNVTFLQNSANVEGGALRNLEGSNPVLTNVTFSANSAMAGAGILNAASNPVLTNVTFLGNQASYAGGGVANVSSNPILTNVILWANGSKNASEIYNDPSSTATVTYSIVQGGYAGTGNLNVDPLLGPLTNNGGFTKTIALRSGSPAIDAGTDANCPPTDQRGIHRLQGSHCDIGAYEFDTTDVDVKIGGDTKGTYSIRSYQSIRQSYLVDDGPVKVSNIDNQPILSSERFIYSFQNSKSYAEMMGYPGDQLATEYWFPWYNNLSYSTQLRVSNMGGSNAEVKVYAANTLIDTFTLSAGEGKRVSYAGLDSGPLHVVSTDGVTPILASERFIQTFMSSASYAEMMGYPGDQLATEYWFPWYNNLSYSTQLRVSNLGGDPTQSAEVKVYAGTTLLDTLTLTGGQGARKSYPVDNGPLRVVSTDGVTPILASERFIQTFGASASYAEMMGYPGDQLTTEYCFPWYNNTSDNGVTLSSQLRVSNMGNSDAQVKVYLAGSEIDSFTILVGQGARKSYATLNNGPLCVQSTDGVTSILASERFISTYLSSAAYSEMMGYPTDRLASSYWFPWYNNNSYSTEFRIAKP